MSGLTAARNTPELQKDKEYFYPVEANTNIYLGAICGLNGNGNAAPMTAATGLKVVGRAEMKYNAQYPGENPLNNPGAAGAISVKLRRGVFLVNNSAASAIAQANVGAVCFAENDITASATDQGASLSAMGRIVGIDISGGIWVDTCFPFAIAT